MFSLISFFLGFFFSLPRLSRFPMTVIPRCSKVASRTVRPRSGEALNTTGTFYCIPGYICSPRDVGYSGVGIIAPSSRSAGRAAARKTGSDANSAQMTVPTLQRVTISRGSISQVSEHFDAVPGPQGDGEKRLYVLAGHKRKAITLGDSGEEQRSFHHREAGTNADAGSTTEWKISEARDSTAADRVISPAQWIEALGIGKEADVTVCKPLHQENIRAGGDAVAVELEIVDGTAADAPGRRIEPHRFLHDHFSVGKPGQIGDGGRSAAQDFA